MRASELQAGKTYVGKNGKRRHLHELRAAKITDGYRLGTVIALYDVPEGGSWLCGEAAFARWAEREATPEESAS